MKRSGLFHVARTYGKPPVAWATKELGPRREPKNGHGVQCPICERKESSVMDSRISGAGIRRRRECKCGYRFTTFEFAVVEAAIDYQI